MKSISTLNSAITENTECSIVKVRAAINQTSGCSTRSQCITMLHFQLLQTNLATFQAKNSVRSAPASLHLPKSRTEVIMRIPQIVTKAVVEKGMEHKGEQR